MRPYPGFFTSPPPVDRAAITVISVGESDMRPTPARFRRDKGWHSTQLMFVIAGAGVGDVAGAPFAAGVGDVCLMPKDLAHGYEVAPGADRWHYRWIEFDGACVPNLLAMFGLAGRAHVARCDAIADPVEQVFALLHARREEGLHEACPLLVQILMLIERAAALPIAQQPQSVSIDAVKQIMAQRLDQPLALAGLAAAVRMSPFHLNRVFRQRTGVPPMRWLRQLRANRAKALLHRREMKVADVGRAVGYPVLQHFSRMFKQETGMTPRRFVREIVRRPASTSRGR
ncbi:MAG TPA: AraC family transcriptional regulator [Planctomycetota bacterium]|nr:AraC family transcriptional regulator [Planctomycetota bacterium]